VHHRIEYDCKCQSCNGTGIYVGMAEHDGFGVVCNSCKGTGCTHRVIEYDDFDGLKKIDNVKQVVQCNPGFCLGVNEKYTYKSFGGMSYEDWWSGKKFMTGSEMRQFVCPCWWYQTADYKKKPDWRECEWGSFSLCSHFATKEKCWERWDKEFVGK
jgi:hypothetical protein